MKPSSEATTTANVGAYERPLAPAVPARKGPRPKGRPAFRRLQDPEVLARLRELGLLPPE